MAIRVGVNGFGRIGRLVLRAGFGKREIEFVALNDVTDAKTMAHLLKYDSIHGIYGETVEAKDDAIVVGGRPVKVFSKKDPAEIPWKDLGVEIVLECSGLFTDREKAAKHLAAGAKRVLISAPAKGEDLTVCLGVNHDKFDPSKHQIISNASCTTNCLAPIAKVLHESFGIQRALMTTIHSYTNDQKILDLPHKDLRRARAAAMSMIPTTTGAAKAVGLVLPELKGKLDGFAVRVPTPNVSLVDLVAEVSRDADEKAVNDAMKAAANGKLKGILGYFEEPLVSIDFNHSTFSSCFDSLLTKVLDKRMVKVMSWYDNEWGFANRMVDVTLLIGGK